MIPLSSCPQLSLSLLFVQLTVLMEALYSLIIVISIRLELSRVCSFVKSVLSLIFFKDIFLNIVVNIEEYITQMFYCKT